MARFEFELHKDIMIANELNCRSLELTVEEKVVSGWLGAMSTNADLGETRAVGKFRLRRLDPAAVLFGTFVGELPKSLELFVDPDSSRRGSVACTHLDRVIATSNCSGEMSAEDWKRRGF
jgi:hypothetical protein